MKTNLKNIAPINAPRWCFNGHLHTISRSLFGNSQKPPCKRLEISTPDNDFLEIDVHNSEQSKGVIALFHGLEGSTGRYYMAELMQVLYRDGYSFVGVNFRSCGSRLNNQKRFYHSGETQDYHTVFQWICSNFEQQPLGAVGFSLGGNALLKSLGEMGSGHPADAAVAVSVPYDLRAGSLAISEGFNRVYDYRFLRTLKKKLEQKRSRFPGLPRFNGTTLYEFDDQVTSKIHGFDDAEDYYQKCSSAGFLPDIKKPTLLIHSREDPLCPAEIIPEHIIEQNSNLDYIITSEGGHVGFLSQPSGWLNRRIVQYLETKLHDMY